MNYQTLDAENKSFEQLMLHKKLSSFELGGLGTHEPFPFSTPCFINLEGTSWKGHLVRGTREYRIPRRT